jgi:hypothetical protein
MVKLKHGEKRIIEQALGERLIPIHERPPRSTSCVAVFA